MAQDYFITTIGNDNTNLIGSKGKNLHVLSKSDFNVPLTYVVTMKAYKHFIAKNNLMQIIHETLQDDQLTSKEKSQKINNLILNAGIPEEIRTELTNYDFFKNPNLKWAVRSSSNLEDLYNFSFAGHITGYRKPVVRRRRWRQPRYPLFSKGRRSGGFPKAQQNQPACPLRWRP